MLCEFNVCNIKAETIFLNIFCNILSKTTIMDCLSNLNPVFAAIGEDLQHQLAACNAQIALPHLLSGDATWDALIRAVDAYYDRFRTLFRFDIGQ